MRSPKQQFAEDIAEIWLQAGLPLTASREGAFANFLRLVHQAFTGKEELPNEWVYCAM